MALITFRNLLDETSEFKEVNSDNLLDCIHQYASTIDSKELHSKVLYDKIVIYINGEHIHPDNWIGIELKDEDEIILTPQLHGGKSGGMIMLVVGAVLMVTAPYIGVPLLSKGVFMLGASMALGGLSSILFSPTLPTLSGYRSSSDSSTQTYNWDGIQTTSKQDIPVSVVYGTHAVGGNVISLFTEADRNNNYLYMLVGLGEGKVEGLCQKSNNASVCITSNPTSASYKIPDIELDNQPIEFYDGVEWWFRDGSNLPGSGAFGDFFDTQCQTKIPYFNDARIQYNTNRIVTVDGITYNTNSKADMVTLKLKAPTLYKTEGAEVVPYTVKFKVDYKKAADSTWNAFKGKSYSPSATNVSGDTSTWSNSFIDEVTYAEGQSNIAYIPAPEYVIKVVDIRGTGNWKSKAVRVADSGPILDRDGNPIGPAGTHYEFVRQESKYVYYKIYDANDNVLRSSRVIKAAFSGTVYIPCFQYNVSVRASESYIGYQARIYSKSYNNITEFEIYGKSKTGLYESINLDFRSLSAGEDRQYYDIRVKRTDGGYSESFKVENQLVLESVTEITQGDFIYPNTVLLGLRIKATGQLSGSPPSVKTVIKGKKIDVPDHSGSEAFEDLFWSETNSRWEYGGAERTWDESTFTEEYSDNAVLCVRDLMLNKRYGLGKYITEDDLYSSKVVSVIKDCHAEYDIPGADVLSWWDNSNKLLSDFLRYRASGTISVNDTTRVISLSGVPLQRIRLLYDIMPIDTITYTFSITLNNTSENVRISIYQVGGPWAYLGRLRNKGDGTHTTSITFKRRRNDGIHLNIRPERLNRNGEYNNLSLDIEDISVSTGGSEVINFHEWNGVLDTQKSALNLLFEMCESFRTWPVWLNGKFSFVMDKDETPVHNLNRSNTNSFAQTFTPLSDIPYKIVGQFTDKDLNYDMNSLTVVSSDDTLRTINEQTVGLMGITDKFRAKRELQFKMNKAQNIDRTVSLKCGLDSIHSTAGDVIYLTNDLPNWGGGGRILSYNSTNASIVLSEEFNFTGTNLTKDYIIRYQVEDNDYVNATVDVTATGSTRTINVMSWPANNPKADAAYAIADSPNHKKYRIVSAVRTSKDEVDLQLINHVASIYTTASVQVFVDKDAPTVNTNMVVEAPTYISVRSNTVEEGIGFSVGVAPPSLNSVKDTIVQMSTNSNVGFETIGIITPDSSEFNYVNNNLILDKTYYIRAAYRTEFKTGEWAYTKVKLDKVFFSLSPPTGVHIKGKSNNASQFDGRDVTIVWNAVGAGIDSTNSLRGYRINVYHDQFNAANRLREEFVTSEEFLYKLEDNIGDSSSSTPHESLVFEISAVTTNNVESHSTIFKARNSKPSSISGLSAVSMIGGARFEWTETSHTDLMHYQYKTRIGTGSFAATWNAVENNYVERTMTGTEIDTYGTNATVFFNVRSKDLYHQTSATASTNIIADRLSDNILVQVINIAAGLSGTNASLYDGNTTSGGVTI